MRIPCLRIPYKYWLEHSGAWPTSPYVQPMARRKPHLARLLPHQKESILRHFCARSEQPKAATSKSSPPSQEKRQAASFAPLLLVLLRGWSAWLMALSARFFTSRCSQGAAIGGEAAVLIAAQREEESGARDGKLARRNAEQYADRRPESRQIVISSFSLRCHKRKYTQLRILLSHTSVSFCLHIPRCSRSSRR